MGRIGLTYQSLLVLSFSVAACIPGDVTSSGYTSVAIDPTPGTNNVVCDPFNTSNPALAGHGIAATLSYLTADMPRYDNTIDYITNGVQAPVTLFLNDINVPTRYFSDGFYTQSGSVLLDADGNTLYEYFALQMQGGITLGPNDTPGLYQFAILSDDGSFLQVNDTGEGFHTVVNDDGTHPTQMGCTTTAVNFTSSSVVPFIYDYHQGPRYHIASVLLWRPMPTDPTLMTDPLCGQNGNNLFYDWTQTPSAPQQAYLDLQSRGWKPLVQENFLLPASMGTNNPCAPSTPVQLSNFQISDVLENSVTLTWNTNVASDTQVFYAPYPSTTYTQVGIAGQTTNHTWTLSGLTHFTVYNVYVSSTNSNNTSSTVPATFRTLE